MVNILQYREIYRREIKGAFFFFGYEKLLLNNTLEYLIKKYTKSDFRSFNLIYLNGEELNLEELIGACETLPVFDNKKLIIVKNSFNFSLEVGDKLFNFLDNLADYVILIFLDDDDKIDKKRKFYKYFKKNNLTVEFEKLKGQDVNRFVREYFILKNREIANADLIYLVEKSGYKSRNLDLNLYDLKNEMDKIFSLAKGKIITREDIDKSISENTDSNIFNFLDALSSKDTSRAIREYAFLRKLNEPSQRILYMIIRQIRLMMLYKNLNELGYKSSEILKKLSISSFEFNKIANFSKNFKLNELYKIHSELLRTDNSLKTTSLSHKVLIEMLIVQITG